MKRFSASNLYLKWDFKAYVKKGKVNFLFRTAPVTEKAKRIWKRGVNPPATKPLPKHNKAFFKLKKYFQILLTYASLHKRYLNTYKYYWMYYIPVTNWLSFLYQTISALGLAFATLQVSSTSSFSRIFTRLPAEWPTISMEVGGTVKIHHISCNNDESFQNTALYSS